MRASVSAWGRTWRAVRPPTRGGPAAARSSPRVAVNTASASGEREDDGEQAAGSHAGQTPGGCGTGACAGSVRFTMPVMPSVGVAT